MAISVVYSNTRGTNFGNSVTESFDASVQAGQVAWMILDGPSVDVVGQGPISEPFSPVFTGSNGGLRVYKRTLTASDIASGVTFTYTAFDDDSIEVDCVLVTYVLSGSSKSINGAHSIVSYASGGSRSVSVATTAGDAVIAYFAEVTTGLHFSGGDWTSQEGMALALLGTNDDLHVLAGFDASVSNPQSATATSDFHHQGIALAFAIRPAQSPTAVQNIAVSPTPVDRSMTVSWDAITDDPDTPAADMQYEVALSTDNGATYTVLGTTDAGETSTVINTTNTTITTTAKVRVRAFDGDQFGPAGFSGTFTIQHAPSTPGLTSPNGGESITIGATFPITWTQSTDPNLPQDQIKYHIQFSANNGTSWTDIVALTTAGASTFNWDTTGRTAGSQYLIRVRAFDSVENLFSAFDTSDAVFTLAAAVAPSAPTITAPTSGQVIDRAQDFTVTWVYNNASFNPQSEATVEWGTDGTAFPNSTIVSGATTSKLFAGGTFPHGNIFLRIKTKSSISPTYGPYANVTFTAGDKPAAPNITAPTAASPPTTSRPTVTFTASGNVAYKYRIVKSGAEVFNSGEVSSTATSFTLGFDLANSVTYTLFLSIKNADGLWSDEDSETFTVAYAGPAVPTITVTSDDANGRITVVIANSDTPDHNAIFRYEGDQTIDDAIRINRSDIAVDGTFYDTNVASGVTYYYFIRAIAATGLFTDSAASAGNSITLSKLWIHKATDQSGVSYSFGNTAQAQSPNNRAGFFLPMGRSFPIAEFADTKEETIKTAVVTVSNTSDLANLKALHAADATLTVRDQFGNKGFYAIDGELSVNYTNYKPSYGADVSFTLRRVDFSEEVS